VNMFHVLRSGVHETFHRGLRCTYNNQSSKVFVKSYTKLSVGDKASVTKVFTMEDVKTFAQLSGDTNPIHTDEQFAKNTRYGKPIVHGTLAAGLLSGIMGTRLPGTGSVLVSYNIEFLAPLYVNESVCAEVELIKLEGRRAVFKMTCTQSSTNKVAVQGECLLVVPKQCVSAESKT